MWKKSETSNELETLIGPSVHLEGNFTSQGNIQIAGSLSGSLQTSGDVKIENGARVQANIIAKNVVIAGEVKGDIKVNEKLELLPTGKLWGNVEAKTLVIASGAWFSGKCNMKNGLKTSEAPKEDKEEK
jgi:cytoskeletal protein CcmA (bactofilin family)